MAFKKPQTVNTDCITCRELLPVYVRLELANQAADAAYPAVAFHIATCPACQTVYWHEFDVQGMAKPLSELQQIGRRAAVATALDRIVPPVSVGLWQRMAEDLQCLIAEIPIRVKETSASFGPLLALLRPQLTLVQAFRSKRTMPEREQSAIELLTLPNPEADLLIKLSTGAVTNHKSTLIVQLETMAHQPIAQARTSLRDQNGSLLELRATDADGLVIFRELEPAKYSIQIKQAGQTWEFSVTLVEAR